MPTILEAISGKALIIHAYPHTFFTGPWLLRGKSGGVDGLVLLHCNVEIYQHPKCEVAGSILCWWYSIPGTSVPQKGCHYVPMSPKKMNASGNHTRFWTWWSLLVGSVWNKGFQYFQFSPPRRQNQADKSCPSCVIAYLIHLSMGFNIWHTMPRVQTIFSNKPFEGYWVWLWYRYEPRHTFFTGKTWQQNHHKNHWLCRRGFNVVTLDPDTQHIVSATWGCLSFV